MGVSFLLCLLPALLATASAQEQITCFKCPTPGKNCQTSPDPATTCNAPTDKGGCITAVEESTLEGISSANGFSRRCIDEINKATEGPFTFTFGPGWYLRTNNKQCKENNCNSDSPEVPKKENKENGLQCPSCFALNTDTCSPVTVPCTGNENLCVKFTGQIAKGDAVSGGTQFEAQGCASKSAEVIKEKSTLVSATYTFTFKTASSRAADKVPSPTPQPTTATTSGASQAPRKVPFALLLPGLTGLLLVKLLS